MAGKPDLSAGPSIQNVVVYVSNENFAQAYTVGQQNVPQNAHLLHNATYGNPPSAMAPSLGHPKTILEKHGIKQAPHYSVVQQQAGYFTSVGYNNDVNYKNEAILKSYGNGEDWQGSTVRVHEDCDSFLDTGYLGAEGPPHSVCCDSVRSETAESSCSSLSSTDEGLVILQNQPPAEMVVYESGVESRTGDGVVVTLEESILAPQTAKGSLNIGSLGSIQCVMVPYGWKRLLNNGSIIYISPSNTVLASPEQVKEYLLSAGTCKCGLECHFKYDSVFNFDPKVGGKPWIPMPDTSTGNLTKLCNHKRKPMAVPHLDGKPPDHVKLRRAEYNIKRKKRKMGLPYAGGVSVSQILAHREKIALNQHSFNKKLVSPHQVHTQSPVISNRLQNFPVSDTQQMLRYPEQTARVMTMGDGTVMMQQTPAQSHSGGHINIQSHQIIGPNGQIINVQSPIGPNQMQIDGQEVDTHQQIFMDGTPNEPTGPGRPNVQMVPVSIANQMVNQQRQNMQQRAQHPQHLQFHNSHPQYQQVHGFDPTKAIRPFGQMIPGLRPDGTVANQQGQIMPQQGQIVQTAGQHNRIQWQNRMHHGINQHIQMQQQQQQQQPHQQQNQTNICERVPPLHQQPPTVWQEEIKRKRVKVGKMSKSKSYHVTDGCSNSHGPCPNIDVRQMAAESRAVIINHLPPQSGQGASSLSFMEDPSGYLAQQTALLNNTINRQTGASGCGSYVCNSPGTSLQNPQQHIISVSNAHSNEVNLPSNVMSQQMKLQHPINQNMPPKQIQNSNFSRNQHPYSHVQIQSNNMADSSHVADKPQYPIVSCQCCGLDSVHSKTGSRPTSNSSTPAEDPVTSSTYSEKQFDQPPSTDPRPIQGGTISTSNDSASSGPPTPTPPQRTADNFGGYPQQGEQCSSIEDTVCCSYAQAARSRLPAGSLVTTMASGRTHGSNTLTSVVAGRTNTATVSINSPSTVATTPALATVVPSQTHTMSAHMSKSPLEMVQNVVSSIQLPPLSVSQHSGSQMSPQLVKHSPAGLSPGHIFVSSGGQLIMASPGSQPQGGLMAPPPPKIQAAGGGMPPMPVSSMITNVTGAVTQVIPALSQQAVLVNAMSAPFVLQQGVAMTMDGMQNVQLPQIVAGNMLQQQIQLEGASEARRGVPALLSPETKKRAKKKKNASQTVAGMLHLAAQQNSPSVVMSQQGFPQHIQMAAHSPQGAVMQALTIVPSKNGGPPQIVMNGQTGLASHPPPTPSQLITTSSQPAQQINLLQPVNLINGTTGVVQNFPAIQQFIVPNLGGSMLMNADGTATILQDASNLGVQLQIQHVNGQNLLTPIHNGGVFGGGGQSILAAGPAGMVIRAPGSQGKIIQQQQHHQQQQQHSPGAQFVAQFGGQLSPLVTGVSPNQQVTFGASPQQMRPANSVHGGQQQEYVQMNGQMGQTLMMPCTPTSNMSGSSSNQQNTTFVQQNTTIVQQQTTMVANNQLHNFPQNNQQCPQQHSSRTATVNLEHQNYVISSNDNKQMQMMVQQQRESFTRTPLNYRQSVSTQTAVHQPTPVTTNTFCQTSTSSAISPPDTTTLSPLPTGATSSGGRSPPTTADTTTHAGGSTDDAASPAPSSTCSAGTGSDVGGPSRPQSCAMAMVHCVSSSEPDSADLCQQPEQQEWRRSQQSGGVSNSKHNNDDSSHFGRRSTLPGMHYVTEQIKTSEVVSSRNYEKMIYHKRKSVDGVMAMDTHQGPTSLFVDDNEEIPN